MINFTAGMVYGAIAQVLVWPQVPWGPFLAAFVWWGANKAIDRWGR